MNTNWIWEENLEAFTQIVARLTGYSSFGKDDWKAIQFGIQDTHFERGEWYEYPLTANHPTKLKFARDIGARVVFVCVEGDVALKNQLELLIDICQDYRVLTRHS